MDYYKFDDDFVFSNGITYLEVDGGWTLRQITIGGGQFVASNVNYPQWGFVLSDQCVNYDDFEEVIPITQQEFDAVWNQHLAQHHNQWETVKALYPIGRRITGTILVFYPQGVIIDLSSNALVLLITHSATHRHNRNGCIRNIKSRQLLQDTTKKIIG